MTSKHRANRTRHPGTKNYRNQNGLRMELELFNLLGDPAILLK